MATKIVSTEVAGNVKPSFASSSIVGLTVRANGEEPTKVLDMNGNMVDAEFPTPTAAPTLVAAEGFTEEQTFSVNTPATEEYNDGRTYGDDRVTSATANFQTTDVGKILTLQGMTGLAINTRNSSQQVRMGGGYVLPAAQNRQFFIAGRNSKYVYSPDSIFRTTDVGLAVTLGGVAATVEEFITANKVKLSVASAPGDNKTLVFAARPVQNLQWVAYRYVYAATQRYPLVENDISIGGSLAPRGMPSPVATVQVYDKNYTVQLTNLLAPPLGRPDLDQVWIFRTAIFRTQQEAQENGEAGNLYFVAAVDVAAGGPAVTYTDENPLEGTDVIEIDNFGIPTFRYVIYADPYWWGWGNMPLSVDGVWQTDGTIEITDGTKWFKGRNNQYVRLENVETGGIGDNGLWLFKWLSPTTAQLVDNDGNDSTVPTAATGKIVIQGPPTTLYRSKPRNPFSWGFTEYLADGSRVPQTYAFKIGGGLGTAIAQVPTVPYLLLSTEYPAGAFTLDLRAAGSTQFERTLRPISNFYSITSHFSQFTATRAYAPGNEAQLRQEKIVLWGWDAKNFAIVECDGLSLNIVSEPVSKTLRLLTQDRSRQLLAHGAYDARNRMNCMWLPSRDSQSQVDLLVMQHAPTNQWFVHNDHDVLCSAQFQDGDTNLSKIYIGTETGLMGEAFADGFYANWVSSGRSLGTCTVATANSITRDDGVQFYLDRDGYVGNWCLITDVNGENEQWGRISALDEWTLTFDMIRQADGTWGTEFNPPIAEGSIFYVGLIECKMRKYFHFGAPAEDKKLSEIWLTMADVTYTPMAGHVGSTFLRYFRERKAKPFAPKQDNLTGVRLHRVSMDDDETTSVWFTQEPPTERIKAFGIEIIDRSFKQWRMYDWTLKVD
jgi:hypothetical protein